GDLRPAHDLDVDALFLEPGIDRPRAHLDLGELVWMVLADVRGGHDRARPVLRSAPGDLDAVRHVRGPVVEPRKDVAVQVDHPRRYSRRGSAFRTIVR